MAQPKPNFTLPFKKFLKKSLTSVVYGETGAYERCQAASQHSQAPERDQQ